MNSLRPIVRSSRRPRLVLVLVVGYGPLRLRIGPTQPYPPESTTASDLRIRVPHQGKVLNKATGVDPPTSAHTHAISAGV